MENNTKAIVKRIMDYLERDNWKYQFVEDKGAIVFGANVGGILKKIDYVIRIEDGCCMLYAYPTLQVDGKNPELMKLIHKFNYNLRSGSMQLDPDDGDLRYYDFLDCSEENLPTDSMLEAALYIPGNLFSKYGDAVVKVGLGVAKTQDALEEAERKWKSDGSEESEEGTGGDEAAAPGSTPHGLKDGNIKVSLFEDEGGDE